MTRPDLDVMEAVAKGATEGPWFNKFVHWGQANVVRFLPEGEQSGSSINGKPIFEVVPYILPKDAKHIATFNPAAMLKLIAYIRELEGALNKRPIVSKFCMKDGFAENAFFTAYEDFSEAARTALRTTGGV